METKFYPLEKCSAVLNSMIYAGLIQSRSGNLHSRAVALLKSYQLLFISITMLCFSDRAFADYTVASGTTVNASTITGQGGVLTVNGRLNVDQGSVSLLNFTRVVIDGTNGQIFWNGNYDLKFAAGISFVIGNSSLGLQPTSGSGNASTRLYIGPTIIIVSSDNSQNAAFSFEIFNLIGGLPEFTLSTSPTSICYGASFTATLTPLATAITYDCAWSATPSSGISLVPAAGSNFSNFNTAQTVSFLYPNIPQSYTLSCKISRAGAGVEFTTKTISVSVNPIPAAPASVSATPAEICIGGSSNLNALSPAGTIQWYTVSAGGTCIGSGASAGNYPVNPSTNTTYYAEAKNSATGCTSASRVPVAITVSQAPVGGITHGSALVCSESNNTFLGLTGNSGTIQWQASTDNSSFNNIAGATSTGFAAAGLTATTHYRALVSNGACPSVTSSGTTITVNPASVAGNINGAVPVCTGANTTTLTLAGNTGVIRWQSSTDNSSFSDIPGATESTYTATNLSATHYYRAVVTSGVCLPVISSPVQIKVIPLSAGGIISGSTAVCLESNATGLTLSENIGDVLKWQSSPVSDFSTDVADIANTTNSLTIANLSATRFYRAVVSTGCGSSWSAVASISIHNLWSGSINADWNNAGNWSDGVLPSLSCAGVTIPAATPYAPVLSTGTAAINNLTIEPGASLTVSGGRLKIAGAVFNGGTFNAENGSIDFTGTSNQTISGNIFVGNTLKNLTVSNNLVVDNSPGNFLNITGVLAFGDADNVTLHTGDNLVLVSTSTNTARVADITNNGQNAGNKIVGKVTVQRYLPARRAWRMFTAPVSGGGNVFDNWQNGGVYQPGKATYVTGPGATNPTGNNGLDWSALSNSSLKAGANFTPVLNTRLAGISKNVADTSDNIAYFIFVRGDRNPVNTNPANKNITTLSSKGKLQTGRQTFNVSSIAGTYNFIGNPYAAPVDLAKIGRNNVLNRFYVWDPNLNAEQGGYIVFDDINNTGTYSYTAGNLTTVLQSGQGFFAVTAANGPASVVFNENAKSSSNNLLAFRPVVQPMSLRINLFHLNDNDKTVLLDGTLAQFDNTFSKGADLMDAPKAANIKEMLALYRDTRTLAIERRPVPSGEDSLFLHLSNTIQRRYRLILEPVAMDTSFSVWLEDGFTGKSVAVNLVTNTAYDFEITMDEMSSPADRFRVIFRRAASKQAPVNRRLAAYRQIENIVVEWEVANEINISRYEVEKSTNGVSFTHVSTIIPNAANRVSNNYSWLDKNPVPGNNYYRISSATPGNRKEYSNTVPVEFVNATAGISIFPNPAEDGVIHTAFKNMPPGIYNIRLINSGGQTVLSKTISHVAGALMEDIQPGFKLGPGIYQLKITVPGNKTTTLKEIIK